MPISLFGEEPKRKAVRKSDRTHLLEFQKGNCWKCKKSFKQMGVRKITHHKNLNPKDNRIVNLVLVCPNCHDKIHQREKKVRVKTTNKYGFTDYKVVKKTTRKKKTTKKKPTKKKTTKKKTTKRKTPTKKKKATKKKPRRRKPKSIWEI